MVARVVPALTCYRLVCKYRLHCHQVAYAIDSNRSVNGAVAHNRSVNDHDCYLDYVLLSKWYY